MTLGRRRGDRTMIEMYMTWSAPNLKGREGPGHSAERPSPFLEPQAGFRLESRASRLRERAAAVGVLNVSRANRLCVHPPAEATFPVARLSSHGWSPCRNSLDRSVQYTTFRCRGCPGTHEWHIPYVHHIAGMRQREVWRVGSQDAVHWIILHWQEPGTANPLMHRPFIKTIAFAMPA